MPWADMLVELLESSTDAPSVTHDKQKRTHMLLGLIGHAVDLSCIDLSDHDGIVRDIRQHYRDAGPAPPASGVNATLVELLSSLAGKDPNAS